VRSRERTLGEFDIIYWCRERQRHFHLELAVKYYLGWRRRTTREPASHWSEWLGPDARDRLDRKMAQLLQHQARLGLHPLAIEQLCALGIQDLAQEVALKGYLFQSLADPLPPPVGFNPELALARWLPLNELESRLEAMAAERFLLPVKTRWLTPVQAGPEDIFLSRATLAQRLQSVLAEGGRARLVAAIGATGTEVCRFFVTANDWPGAQDENHSPGRFHDNS
jgi:hypothetical protein